MSAVASAAAPVAAETAARPKKLIIIIAAAAAIVLVAAGLVLKSMTAPKEPAKDPAKEYGAVVALEDDMTLNLADGKFLKTKMSLQLSEAATVAAGGEKGLAKFDGSMARDAAIGILSRYTYDQLLKPANRESAQKALSVEVKQRYESKVLKVYFTEFVMQ
ncbi:MAG TPA: flagellar basal body-associated FliL family protein [Dermatophilaceae bacterium]|nr:flagellar basal body-associated FliL family protein [Dermatophilaceae bacterium]